MIKIESFTARDDALLYLGEMLDSYDGFCSYLRSEITKIDGKWRVGITDERQMELPLGEE